MKTLKVPFIRQKPNHCGAAVLEMVYKYYGITDVTQIEIFQHRSVIDPETNTSLIWSPQMKEDAIQRNFRVLSGGFTFENHKDYIDTMNLFLSLGLPPIVCQRWEHDESLGHFKIVVGLNTSHVIVHNSDNKAKEYIPHDEFHRLWTSNGKTVSGNFMMVIAPRNKVLPAEFPFEG